MASYEETKAHVSPKIQSWIKSINPKGFKYKQRKLLNEAEEEIKKIRQSKYTEECKITEINPDLLARLSSVFIDSAYLNLHYDVII